jgi:hypothetical protein
MNKLHLVGNIRSCSFRYMLSTVDKSIADLKEDEAFLELEISYSQVPLYVVELVDIHHVMVHLQSDLLSTNSPTTATSPRQSPTIARLLLRYAQHRTKLHSGSAEVLDTQYLQPLLL